MCLRVGRSSFKLLLLQFWGYPEEVFIALSISAQGGSECRGTGMFHQWHGKGIDTLHGATTDTVASAQFATNRIYPCELQEAVPWVPAMYLPYLASASLVVLSLDQREWLENVKREERVKIEASKASPCHSHPCFFLLIFICIYFRPDAHRLLALEDRQTDTASTSSYHSSIFHSAWHMNE